MEEIQTPDPSPQLAELAAMGAGLQVVVDRLGDSVDGLAGTIGEVDRRGRRNTIGLWLISLGFAMDIALTITMAFVVAGLNRTNHNVQESLAQNYVTAATQAQTRVRVLCPLYEILLAAAAAPSPQSQATAPARAQFDRAVQTIREGYSALGCQKDPPQPK